MRSVATCSGEVLSAGERPEPSTTRGWIPNSEAIVLATTAAPCAVVPLPVTCLPMSLTSVSAKKLSDGGSISPTSWLIVGDATEARSVAAGGVGAAPIGPWMETPSAWSVA